jgi:MFS family permease
MNGHVIAIQRSESLARISHYRIALAGIIASTFIFAFAQGLTYPLLSFILHSQDTSASLIGLSAAMTPLGIIASALFVPWICRRFSGHASAVACAMGAAILLALIGWCQNVLAWFPLRFLLGAAIGYLYVLGEIWVIALTPASQRGRVIGVYTTVLSAGFAAGASSLVLVGTAGWPPFLVGVAASVGCGGLLGAFLSRLPPIPSCSREASIRRFLPNAPTLLVAVAVAAALEQGLLALLPVYGAASMDARTISFVLALLLIGNLSFQIPLGLIAERFTPRRVMIACATGTSLCCVLMAVAFNTILVWPLIFLLGALSCGIYTMSIVELGDRFSGAMLVAGNAAFSLMWGLGGLAGPLITGSMMDTMGGQGLPLTLGFSCFCLAVVASVPLSSAGWNRLLSRNV